MLQLPQLSAALRPEEEKEVLWTDFLADFHIRAVKSANSERAVKREFHVACAARFLARRGNLLGQIRGRIDEMRVLHIEVGKEDDLKPVQGGAM